MQSEEVVKDIFLRVDGWLTYREGLFLFNSAKKCRSGTVIVEIGSWKGRSTICLAKGSKAGNGVKVIAIDPHIEDTFDEFLRNIRYAGVGDVVVPVIKTSKEASNGWSTPVDFIFVDGSHEYELVKKDFELWYPYIKEDGIIALSSKTWKL